jgi:hypothetical protein
MPYGHALRRSVNLVSVLQFVVSRGLHSVEKSVNASDPHCLSHRLPFARVHGRTFSIGPCFLPLSTILLETHNLGEAGCASPAQDEFSRNGQ